MSKRILAVLAAAALGLAACAGKRAQEEAPVGETVGTEAGTAGADTTGVGSSELGADALGEEGAGVDGPQEGLLAQRIIYFDFDSSEIRGAGTDLVAAHARYLASNPGVQVRLEGHTDERGSREYNIGLGERRAQAVRRALSLQGAADTQLSTVSYGEERPAAAGADEAAWTQNRRVEIVYLTR